MGVACCSVEGRPTREVHDMETMRELSDFVGRLSVAVVAAHDADRLRTEGELSA